MPDDLLTDLKEEIAEEEKAAAAASQDTDSKAQEEVEGRAKTEEPAPKPQMVPVGRVNEETAKRRQAERALAAANAELEKLRNPSREDREPQQLSPEDIEKIRTQERAQARLELQVNEFLEFGNSKYTQASFDEACNKIAAMDAPQNLVSIAIEATGSPKSAAEALYNLGQEDVAEIEKFLKLSPLRMGAQLASYVGRRARKAATVEDRIDEAPKPLKPVNGNGNVPDGLGDDVPEDVWGDRFDAMMDKSWAKKNGRPLPN